MSEQLLNKIVIVTDTGHSKAGAKGKIVRYNQNIKRGITYLIHLTQSHEKVYLRKNQFKLNKE